VPEQDKQEPIDAELVEDPAPAPAGDHTGAHDHTGDYTEGGVPTFDYVRDQIENRTATSAGATELAGESPQGRSVEQQFADREKAGRDKLEEIRRAMREKDR
jgi:phage shock protein A